MTASVKQTLARIGEFKFKSTCEEPVIKLGPQKFKDNKSVYNGQWYKGMRWGKGK